MSNKTDRTFECPKCKEKYLETDKHVTRCTCPTCHIIMKQLKGGLKE